MCGAEANLKFELEYIVDDPEILPKPTPTSADLHKTVDQLRVALRHEQERSTQLERRLAVTEEANRVALQRA